MDLNTDVTESKVFLDLLLGDCWRRRYFYAPNFFKLSLKTCFIKKILGVLLELDTKYR
jgi:hypothetical protein